MGKTKKRNMIYQVDILKLNNFEITNEGKKNLYNTDSTIPLNRWLKDTIKGEKTFDVPQLSSALVIKPNGYGRMTKDGIGYLLASQNIPQTNQTMNAIFTSAFSAKNGISITKNNFKNCVIHFAVRKMIQSNWLNEKDEYIAPLETERVIDTFYNDSIILFLFNSASEQSSLRQITYKDKLWDIKNEFFWMSKEEMMDLANNSNYTELYNDGRTDNNRYVHKLLFGEEDIYNKLSPDAKVVLDKATEMVRQSITIRSNFADNQNHLNSWDAGYAQLKLLWKEFFPEDFKEFRLLYKNLEDRMRPLVYELGFLLK